VGGEDERMDCVGGGGEGCALHYSFLLFLPFCSGEPYPELCAQCTNETEDLLSVHEKARRGPSDFPFAIVYVVHIPLQGEGRKAKNCLISTLLESLTLISRGMKTVIPSAVVRCPLAKGR